MNYPNATQRPGPTSKVNGGVNTCHGVVCHSMVGTFAGAMGELDKPSRRASWCYSVCQDGRIFAHYPDEAQTWHAGSARNNDLIGIEHEGGFNPEDEPLTPPQLAASVALVRWLAQAHGFPLVRGVGLFEHHEVSGAVTQCPSGRIPWGAYTQEDEDMKPFLAWDTGIQTMYLIGPFGAAHVVYPADAAVFETMYGKLAVALSHDTILALS